METFARERQLSSAIQTSLALFLGFQFSVGHCGEHHSPGFDGNGGAAERSEKAAESGDSEQLSGLLARILLHLHPANPHGTVGGFQQIYWKSKPQKILGERAAVLL